MKGLMKMEDREIKQGADQEGSTDKVKEYRKKISDKSYMDHAINRIATDLSHYLTK